MIEGKYRYYAFISYKREEEQWAKWLQHKLEHYKLPTNLNGRSDLPKEVRPVFKDTSELIPGNLPEQIREALELSKYLIVLCSPNAAKSEWVNKEVEVFMSMGRTNNIIPFIIDGIPFSSNHDEECFPKAILSLPPDQELLGANINEMGRDAAAVKTVARMFGIRFDELWHRHEREQKRRRNIIISAVAAFVLAVIGVAFWMYLQRQETLRVNWEMMENQARMVAEKSKDEVKKGNTYDAILALLEMVPQDGGRPFVPELEEALRSAYDSLRFRKWNYRFFDDQNYESFRLSSDEKIIVFKKDSVIDTYLSKNLQKYSSFEIKDSLRGLPSFLSHGNDTIYFMDSLYVKCFMFQDGRFVKKMAYTESVLNQCMSSCCDVVAYQDWPWITEWKKMVGIPVNAIILDYNPIKRLVLYGLEEEEADGTDQSSFALYDCESRRVVRAIDDNGSPFSLWGGTGITSTSFSPDGRKLAIAYRNGKGQIFDLDDFSSKVFECGSDDCAHYSNWLGFGRNGQLLHTSMYDILKIFDAQSLSLVDSLDYLWLSDGIAAEMNSTGDICLIGDSDTGLICYHYDNKKTLATNDGFEKIGNHMWYDTDIIINSRFHISNGEGVLRFSDLDGEYMDWSRDDKDKYLNIKGFIQDDKYMIVVRTGFRDAQYGTDIIDVVTGITVYHLSPDFYVDCVYYNKESNLIAFGNEEGPQMDYVIDFPSFDHVVSLCRKATDGMVLSNDARRKFYLNKTK